PRSYWGASQVWLWCESCQHHAPLACVAAADRDQMFDAERREVRQRLLGDIPGPLPLDAPGSRKVLGGEVAGSLRILEGWFGRCAARCRRNGRSYAYSLDLVE